MAGKNEMFVTAEEEKVLRVTAGVEEEPTEVFYTDENPTFKLKISNLTDTPVEGTFPWHLDIGNGKMRISKNAEVRIDGNSEEIRSLTPSLLAVQDSGYIAAELPYEQSIEVENGVIKLSTAAGETPLYTFSVWDRDFYRANYVWPRRSQIASVVLAVLIVLVGVISLL